MGQAHQPRSDQPRSSELQSLQPTDNQARSADPVAEAESVIIDCDDCAVRGAGCRDCVVSVLLGVPEMLLVDERRALEALADAGLAPRLRLVPVHRQNDAGVA